MSFADFVSQFLTNFHGFDQLAHNIINACRDYSESFAKFW